MCVSAVHRVTVGAVPPGCRASHPPPNAPNEAIAPRAASVCACAFASRTYAAEVEEAPAQAEAQGLVRTAGEQIAARNRRGAAEQRAERELRVVLRHRHADARIGGCK